MDRRQGVSVWGNSMGQKKQILVVDDHFEMLEFLRSMLTIANPEHEVLGVPSAEEGFLELRRTPFDLVITDVRLPGISGFELVKRIKKLRSETPIIMITAYSSGQGKEEAEQLGVFRYFRKPLDTDALLAAVRSALSGEPEKTVTAPLPAVAEPPGLDGAVRARLRALRTDTGAAQIALVRNDGRILFHLAEGPDGEEVRLAQIAASAMRNSLELAKQLRNDDPVMFQYQAGRRFDLYTANVGKDYFVLLLFGVRERRGRIGTIWIFAQRAIGELKEMLPEPPGEEAPPQQEPQPAQGELLLQQAEPLPIAASPRPEPQRTADPEPPTSTDTTPPATPEPAHNPAGERLGETAPEPEVAGEASEVTSGELAELLGSLDEPLAEEVDLDAFWEEATEDEKRTAGRGLSFDEAVARGLLPPRFKGEES